MTQRSTDTRLRAGDLLISDFDGTITVIDTGLAFFEALDLAGAWEVEWEWRRGEINSMECLQRQWALVNLSAAELFAFVDGLELDPDFPALVRLCHERRAGFIVVSDGLDFYLDRLLRRAGFEPCDGDRVVELTAALSEGQAPDCLPRFVNHAVVTDHRITVEFPCRVAECSACGNCKAAHLFRLRPHFRRVFYLGDGHSDMCAARFADVIFAKEHLLEFCREQGIAHLPFETLGEVVAAIG
jgi:2-hydroxy-3-keto-5-methylthiopentenyl-1-phosphate phosphatase